MPTATLTSKGQLTLPRQVRVALGVEAGDRIDFVPLEGGRFAVMPATAPLAALKGVVRKPDRPVPLADMDAAIAEGAARP